jgi:Domain of unknown function (DUF4282)
MRDFFAFRRMITPTIIEIVFWIGLAITAFIGLALLIAGGRAADRLFGLFFLIFGPLAVRVYCEILIVIFKVHETLLAIERNTAGAPPSAE